MEKQADDNKTFYILDSYGLIYREYFAFIHRPLTNSSGQNISAVFGFFRNLSLILKKYKPQYIAAAFDSRTPTFRHEMYDQYKATRQKTPDDLKIQFPWIEELLSTLGIPVLRCDGYEADDVIATIAEYCSREKRPCRILSADKDLMQLVGRETFIMKPDRDQVWAEVGPDDVYTEWGVVPEKMLDLLSLTGDSADNIPGVKGVGIKTAVKLLEQYKSLDGIYEHAAEITGAVGEKIRNDRDNAYFSQKLIRLYREVPCAHNPADFAVRELHYEDLARQLEERGMPAAAKSYHQLAAENNEESKVSEKIENVIIQPEPLHKNEGHYTAVTKKEVLTETISSLLRQEKCTVAFDCETDSLNTREARLVGFSLSSGKGTGIYIPLILSDALFSDSLIFRKEAFEELERLFAAPEVTIVMHNAKFDLEVLASNGFPFSTRDITKRAQLADTMIAAWLLEPDRMGRTPYSLEYLAETKLALAGTGYESLVPKDGTFADVPLEQAAAYGAEDADFTLQLWNFFYPRLSEAHLLNLFTNMEMKILPILADMELRGIHLDTAALREYAKQLTADIDRAEKDIYDVVGHPFNIASTKQLQEVLFTERGLIPGKKTKTGYSTDTAVLEELALTDPVPKKILDYRMLTKLLSTYVDALPDLTDKNGRIHTSFIQTGTATGRLSSRDPNLQNIPIREESGRRIRNAFTAAPGTVLISADYAQIELVVLAHLSSDKNLCAAFIEGVDVHRATASLIYGIPPETVSAEMRRSAKTINFGVMYGMSAFRLANELGISRTQAAAFISNYFTLYSGVRTFIDEIIAKAEDNGFVETITGRRRFIGNIHSRNKNEKSGAERIAINTPIQGSAADIVKEAMIAVDQALKEEKNGAQLLLQVHDELILECPDDPETISNTIALVKDKMEHAVKLQIPLRVSVEYGKSWGEFH
jgi:DNA polymerase I